MPTAQTPSARCRWFAFALATCSPHAACGADDIAPLSDEFDAAATIAEWQDLAAVEGWGIAAHELADIDTTEPGRFHIVPAANTWFGHLRGLLFFKEITGDFVATARVRVLSRHNPLDPTEPPDRSFSLTGIFIHGPRPITQAAPSPYTTDAVWPPGDFGSDYLPNTENYIFLSYGSAGDPGTRQFEIKATRDSDSRLYYSANGIDQSETEAWLQLVRVGDTVVCLRKHSAAGPWIVENRYPNPRHPFPDFGATLQVGITAYTDWPAAAPFNSGGLESSYHFNYAPPDNSATRDLVSQVDYFRLRRPDPALSEAVLQGMTTSFDPAGNFTADPPVELAASPAAAPFLGENADLSYDPYRDWRDATFGADAALPLAAPDADPDGDGLTNAEEFVLGGSPMQSSTAPEPVSEAAGDTFTFRFTPAVADGAELTVQRASDLASDDWTTVAQRPLRGGPWQVPDGTAGLSVDPETGAVAVTIPATAARTFVRLRVRL